jgi:DNA polymerase type B, organellar and viral
MAGGAEGYENQVLEDESGLSSARIFEWLLSQPRQFADRDPHGRQPIFAAYGASYDQAQILADLPNSKVWEFHTRKKWWRREKGLPDEARQQSIVLWGPYAVSGKPRKNIVLYKLRNPDRWWKLIKGHKVPDYVERIEIFDVVGFFQSSLLKAIETFPGVVTPAELEILKRGKADRGHVTKESVRDKIPGLKLYTANELKATARMMELVRKTLETAIPGRPIKLKNWWGAGAIAQELLRDYLGKDARAKLGDIKTPLGSQEIDLRKPLEWGFRGYFGGRGDLLMQGLTGDILHFYDIASAYPAQIAQLPSMEGGKWVYRKNPTREEIDQSNMLSMFRVETYNFKFDLPFYPFPFRTKNGAIMFPANVKGVYMRDDVVAALKWFDEFERQGRLCNRLIHPEGPEIRVTEALFFVPATDEKPFAFVQELFDLRASIIAENKDDVRGVILKLAINSIYGKLTQSVGRKGEPPAFASPWMAAAITAGTRRRLIEAALTAPDSIVCFAVDGIISRTRLDVFVPPTKTLGHWEYEEVKHGGVFVQSGVYAVIKDRANGDKGVKIASRGFSPQNIGVSEKVSWTQATLKVLFEDIPNCWKQGKPAYVFERQQYITVGASLARNPPPPVKGPKAGRPWRPSLIGSWIKSDGKLQLDAMSRKRIVPSDPALRSSRSEGLIALTVNQWPLGGHTESFPSRPKWMDAEWFGPEWTGVKEDQEEGVEKDYEGESEIDALDEQDDVIAGLSAG